MPTLAEAQRFAADPRTSAEQLRRACEILGLDSTGTDDDLRARLRDHLRVLAADQPVVCLNPGLTR